jgi:hypothetical protein
MPPLYNSLTILHTKPTGGGGGDENDIACGQFAPKRSKSALSSSRSITALAAAASAESLISGNSRQHCETQPPPCPSTGFR